MLPNQKHDQLHGGSFNPHKNWKKLREKHRKIEEHTARGGNRIFEPEVYTPSSSNAGKGDKQRSSNTPKEIYDLNYELAFGRITKEEYEQKVKQFWEGS